MNKSIFLCTEDPGVGGVAQYNYSLIDGLTAKGYRVTYVQNKRLKDLIQLERELDVEQLWIDNDNLEDFRKHLLNSTNRPDLIICSNSNPFSNFTIKQIAIQLEIPYIIVEGLVEPHLAEKFATYLNDLSQHYKQAKSVIAVSQDNLNLLHKLFKLSQNHGQVIYYGRPPEYFKTKDLAIRDRLRQELSIPSDAVVCFTAARIETRKGYQYQLEAIKQLVHSPVWSQLYFVWVGGGIFEPQLETYLKQSVKQLGITEKVKFLGQRSDIPDWLNIADIFVFPSQLEGMPICVMEAMAKGLPVIATAVSGIPEELGDTGKLLPDPKVNSQATTGELIRAIQDWVVNPELCDEIGQACKKRAEQMFREERMIEETVQAIEEALLPSGDYVSPGFSIVRPDQAFPNMVVGDTKTCSWTYLRREIPHNWYVDKRQPTVGFASRDEAHILYNTALKFKGKRSLEIGCWLGWSACHLALAGIELDVIDPLLSRPDFYESVSDSLKASGVLSRVNLVGGYSPEKVEELAAQLQRKWSLIFIDGNHDALGPLNDAIVCEKFAEDDALILFHDLASPEVAQGLDYLKQRGWQTMVYQTMQIMGVAWRGNAEPIMHQPDPKINWVLPSHLQDYQVSRLYQASNRLKVTFCTCDDPNFTGGPNSWLRRLLPALKLAGIDVSILFFVTTDSPESCPCFRYLQDQGIECHAFRWQTTTEQKIHWLLSKLAETPPDVFVPNMLVAAFYTSRWVKAAGIPTVGVLHADDEFHRSVLRNFVLGEAAYRFSALVCVSKFLEQYVHNLLQVEVKLSDSKTIIQQIPYGVPLSQQLAQFPTDCLKLIYVGRLEEEQKQISEVTRALCRAVRTISNVKAIIVGEGSAKANVEKIIVEEGKNLPIQLLGLVDNSHIQAIMSEQHVLVLLSDYEGLPISLMEAMACGLVPICLQIRSGIPELVEDGITGLLVNDREDEFISAVRRLKSQPELWRQLSQAARTKVEESYSNEVCTTQWLSLFRRLHEKAGVKQSICNPQRLNLPPVDPAFVREDYRQASHLDISMKEFREIFTAIQPYTLLDEGRLFSLYSLAKRICLEDIPGNFVECGTYKGGAAALLATVIKYHSLRPRRLYAFDTFEGMPDPTAVDRHNGIPANLTDAGAGTLKAPIAENLAVICRVLNVSDIVVPVKGLFADTLPQYKSEIGSIAFLHADGDWYESTMDILNNLYDRVVSKGVIQLDDYGYWEGCRKAIHDFESRQTESFVLHSIGFIAAWFQKGEEKSKPLFIVDGVFFQLYKTGIARVWRSLLEKWVESGFAKHILVLDRALTALKIPGIRYRTVPAYDYANTEADRAMLQQICDEENADLFISSYYTTPLSTPSVFLAHDMIPELMGTNLNHPMWREKHYGIQHANAYITVSEQTARDLVKFFPDISLESVTVAQNGVDRQIFSPANSDKIDRFKTKYGIYKPYFLIVGAGAGYKNSILFLKAFAQLPSKQGFDIVCTGSGYISDVDFRTYTSGSTVHMLQLGDEELSIAYSGAVALVYPSKYEGFGLPVLEAIACGCPVITCPNGAIPEVAGEAALYVNDEDVDGLANALCEVQKPIVRNSLSFAGLQQAQKFSWSKMAETISSTLINATLLPLNLREINLIIFPDWSQSEETISEELEQVIRAIATHPDSNKITLLVDKGNLDEEEVGLILSGVSMNLLMQEDLDISESAEISLIGQLSEVQWQALLPRIQARIVMKNENRDAIAHVKAENLPSCELDNC